MDEFSQSDKEFSHQRHVSVTSALKARKNFVSNIWVMDSPKNNKRFIVEGDVAFMHLILLEGDTSVLRYDADPLPVTAVVDGESRRTKLDAIVYFEEGRMEWWEFKRSPDAGPGRRGRARPQLSAQAQAAAAAGVPYRVLTEHELQNKQVLFENWLLLCAAITRARHHSTFREAKILDVRLATHGALTLAALLQDGECDPALMLALIAKLLQQGLLQTDLETRLFGMDSMLKRKAA